MINTIGIFFGHSADLRVAFRDIFLLLVKAGRHMVSHGPMRESSVDGEPFLVVVFVQKEGYRCISKGSNPHL